MADRCLLCGYEGPDVDGHLEYRHGWTQDPSDNPASDDTRLVYYMTDDRGRIVDDYQPEEDDICESRLWDMEEKAYDEHRR